MYNKSDWIERRWKAANSLREDQKTDTISFSVRRKIWLSISGKFVTFQSRFCLFELQLTSFTSKWNVQWIYLKSSLIKQLFHSPLLDTSGYSQRGAKHSRKADELKYNKTWFFYVLYPDKT